MTTDDAPTCRSLGADLRALRHVFNLLDDRVDLCESDLDCDTEGSLAQAIGELRADLSELRALVVEWIPRAADDERRREAV